MAVQRQRAAQLRLPLEHRQSVRERLSIAWWTEPSMLAMNQRLASRRGIRGDNRPRRGKRVEHFVGNDPLGTGGRPEAAEADIGIAYHHSQSRIRHGIEKLDAGQPELRR